MDSEAEKIGKSASKIRDEVRKATAELRRVADKGKATLRTLEIELDDEQAEVDSPIIAGHYEPRTAENDDGAPSAA